MRAVILAAGIGNRLRPITDKMPKSLIPIRGRTILERMLDSLTVAGVKDITIVVGYLKDMIIDLAGDEHEGAKIGYVENKEYRSGSIISLLSARNELSGEDILLMDADVVFEQKVLDTLIGSGHKNCFLADKNFNDSGEEMKIAALNKRVVQIDRRITRPHDEVGEGIGFLKISSASIGELLGALDKNVSLNRAFEYEKALDDFISGVDVRLEDITGLKWTEVDFPEDIRKAESLGL